MVTEKSPRWARFRLSLFSRVGSFYNIVNSTLPKAFRHVELGLVDAYVMYRFFDAPTTR
jgi:hypothetical protein